MQTRLAFVQLAQAVGQSSRTGGRLGSTGSEALGSRLVGHAGRQLADRRGLAQQAVSQPARPFDNTLRSVGQPTLRTPGSIQSCFELLGAGLKRAGSLRDALADERQLASFEPERYGAIAQHAGTGL